jgi:hypothetical protein
MKIKRIFIFLTIFMVMSSCESSKNMYVHTMSKSDVPYDMEWHQFLANSKDQLKSLWLTSFGGDVEFYVKAGTNLSSVEAIRQSEVLPVETYRMSYQSFAHFNAQTSFSDALTLSKEDALLQIVNNGNYIGYVRLKYAQDKWRLPSIRLCQIKKSQFSDVVFKRKLQISNVLLTESSGFQMHFHVYVDEKGELMNISMYSTIRPFREVLLDYKKGIIL